MANTYLQIYLHIVFAVKNREALIPPFQEETVYSYMAKVLQNLGHKPIIIGGTNNHVHILVAYNPNQLLPDMVKELKTSTTKFINTRLTSPFKFEWQRGYACLSYSHSMLPQVYRYIQNQKEHHKSQSVHDEIKLMLTAFNVDFDEKYIITDPE